MTPSASRSPSRVLGGTLREDCCEGRAYRLSGTGKTTVGRILANRLGLPFYDTDALIEQRAGMPIPEIFRRAGEAHFRALEREVIASLGPQRA